MSLKDSIKQKAKRFLEDRKNKRDLKKAMKEDARMDILKAKLEAKKEQEIYLAEQKEKIKTKHELEQYHQKLKINKKIRKARLWKIILLIVLLIVLIYLATYS